MGTLSTTANDTVTFRAVLPQVPFGAQRGPFVFLFGGLSFAPLTDRIHVIRSLQMVSVGPSPCGSPGQPIAGDSCRLSGLVAGKRDRSLSLATFPPTASHSSPAMVGPHTFGSSVAGRKPHHYGTYRHTSPFLRFPFENPSLQHVVYIPVSTGLYGTLYTDT